MCHIGGGFGRAYVLDLVFIEEGRSVDDHPRNAAAEIEDLVHDKAHDTGGQDVVLHPQIPGLKFDQYLRSLKLDSH